MNREEHSPLSTEFPNELFHEILPKPLSCIEQSRATKGNHQNVVSSPENVPIPIANDHLSSISPECSVRTSERKSMSNDQSYCAFEVVRINGNEQSS